MRISETIFVVELTNNTSFPATRYSNPGRAGNEDNKPSGKNTFAIPGGRGLPRATFFAMPGGKVVVVNGVALK